jgi:hypothetical protein
MHTSPYKLQRSRRAPSCSIESFEIARISLTRRENEVKRLTLTLIAGALLAAALGGCVVVPAPGYYYGGGYYHHGGGYYYR